MLLFLRLIGYPILLSSAGVFIMLYYGFVIGGICVIVYAMVPALYLLIEYAIYAKRTSNFDPETIDKVVKVVSATEFRKNAAAIFTFDAYHFYVLISTERKTVHIISPFEYNKIKNIKAFQFQYNLGYPSIEFFKRKFNPVTSFIDFIDKGVDLNRDISEQIDGR